MYPTDLAEIDLKRVKAIVVERQNIHSHISILIRSLRIPYLIKTDGPVDHIRDGEEALLDCHKGILHVKPDQKTISEYEEYPGGESTTSVSKDKKAEGLPELFATVNTIEEAALAASLKVEGIGLFRTELSFLNADIGLKLKEQVSAYKKILAMFPDKPVILRTLDLGGDKSSFLNLIYKDELPEGRKRPLIRKLYNRQIEALIRAAGSGNLIIAFPMISRSEDMKLLVDQVVKIKKKQKNPLKIDVPTCAFIESPAGVYSLDGILEKCDHINIGTNDLLSLIYAQSRQISRPLSSEDYLQPPTINVLGEIIEKTHSKGKKVTICGGITSSPKFLPILVGLGADSISVELKRYGSVRELLCRTDPQECRKLVKKLKGAGTKKEIISMLSSYGFDR